jgi:hypothetical protein
MMLQLSKAIIWEHLISYYNIIHTYNSYIDGYFQNVRIVEKF